MHRGGTGRIFPSDVWTQKRPASGGDGGISISVGSVPPTWLVSWVGSRDSEPPGRSPARAGPLRQVSEWLDTILPMQLLVTSRERLRRPTVHTVKLGRPGTDFPLREPTTSLRVADSDRAWGGAFTAQGAREVTADREATRSVSLPGEGPGRRLVGELRGGGGWSG